MNYVNGEDIFPKALLKQIQKYVSGRLVYIPIDGDKKTWGESSGYKQYLQERNRDIKLKFKNGTSIEQLAEEFYLSIDSIKKIVYSRKEEIIMKYACSLTSAKEFSKNGKLEEWVHTYLLSDGHNKEFSDGLKLFDRYFLGPIKMPLSLFERCCGPEANMTYKINEEWFNKHVQNLMNVIASKADMPPMIVHYVDGSFELNDGNHRLEAYNRLGVEEYEVIVWITEKAEYEDFVSKYSQYLTIK